MKPQRSVLSRPSAPGYSGTPASTSLLLPPPKNCKTQGVHAVAAAVAPGGGGGVRCARRRRAAATGQGSNRAGKACACQCVLVWASLAEHRTRGTAAGVSARAPRAGGLWLRCLDRLETVKTAWQATNSPRLPSSVSPVGPSDKTRTDQQHGDHKRRLGNLTAKAA